MLCLTSFGANGWTASAVGSHQSFDMAECHWSIDLEQVSYKTAAVIFEANHCAFEDDLRKTCDRGGLMAGSAVAYEVLKPALWPWVEAACCP